MKPTPSSNAQTSSSQSYAAWSHDIAWSNMPSQWVTEACSGRATCPKTATPGTGNATSSSEFTAISLRLSSTASTLGTICIDPPCPRAGISSTKNINTKESSECRSDLCMARTGSSRVPSAAGLTNSMFRTTRLSPTSTTVTAATATSTGATCPVLLPRCLNTWLFVSQCQSNTDTDCFCKSEDFITGTMGCIDSWSRSAFDRDAARICLQGICANHISENPAIITAGSGGGNARSSIPRLVCPDDRGPMGHSQHPCTTITYLPTEAASGEQTPSTLGQPNRHDSQFGITSEMTVTLPLIFLGTSTVTSSLNVPSNVRETADGSMSGFATPTFGPFTYHSGNNSRIAFGTSSGVGSGYLPSVSSNNSVQTLSPYAGGIALPTHPIGLSFAGLALAVIF